MELTQQLYHIRRHRTFGLSDDATCPSNYCCQWSQQWYGWRCCMGTIVEQDRHVQILFYFQQKYLYARADQSRLFSLAILARREKMVCDMWSVRWYWLFIAVFESVLCRRKSTTLWQVPQRLVWVTTARDDIPIDLADKHQLLVCATRGACLLLVNAALTIRTMMVASAFNRRPIGYIHQRPLCAKTIDFW